MRETKLGKEMEGKLREIVGRLRDYHDDETIGQEGCEDVMRLLALQGRLGRINTGIRGGYRGLRRGLGRAKRAVEVF
jgi:hypothetical protein